MNLTRGLCCALLAYLSGLFGLTESGPMAVMTMSALSGLIAAGGE